MKYLLTIVFILLSSCKELPTTQTSRIESGLDLPISNLPLNSIYVEYPTSEGEAYVGNSPCDSEPPLVGKWVYIKDYDGAFFRTESSNREFVKSGMGFNLLENQSRQYHEHYHEHPHIHDTVSETHTHEHEHEHHDHNVRLETQYHGLKQGGLSGVGKNYMPGNDQIDAHPTHGFNLVARLGVAICDRWLDSDGDLCMRIRDNTDWTRDIFEFIPSSRTLSSGEQISEIDDIRPKNYTVRLWKKIDHDVSCTQMVVEYNENGAQLQDEYGEYIYKQMEFTPKERPKNKYKVVNNEVNTYTEVK